MMIAMRADATPADVDAVLQRIRDAGLEPVALPGGERVAIGIKSAIPVEVRETLAAALEVLPAVDHVTHISRPYKLASREFYPENSMFTIKDVVFGGDQIVIMAGPCAIESEPQLRRAAECVKAAGARVLRGGAFKPRTSPYSFQGLGVEGLQMLRSVADEVGMLTITEVVDPHEVELVTQYTDILQIGARNMQNFPLLIAAGETRHPVLIKRGPSATIDEWLLAAEYCLSRGSTRVLLCERGVHPIDRTYARHTLDLTAVPVVKEISHLPVIIDPSHATGNARYVPAMARAGLAAGADGLLIEVHPDPVCALCDGPQSLTCEAFASLMGQLHAVAAAVGRSIE
jgi:3-deoxy-7-phosphoheptulonate synthase